MNFDFPSNLNVAEKTRYRDMYIAAAQDVRDIFQDFNTEEVNEAVESVEYAARPAVDPAASVGRFEVASPQLPTEQIRKAELTRVQASRTEELIGMQASTLPRMEKAMQDNLASYAQTRSISWIAAAKGEALIKVIKDSTKTATLVPITAENDGVIRLDAIGGTDSGGNPLPLGVDDMITAISAHAVPNLGNMVGIAGGATMDSGMIKGAAYCVMTPFDLGDLMKDNRQALLGEINYQPVGVYSGSPLLTERLTTFMGYPLVQAGAFNGAKDPSTILDMAGDSVIIDNGDGTFDIERDIIFATGESVARAQSPRIVGVGKENRTQRIYNITLEGSIGAVRLKGSTLLFLRVQRTISAFVAKAYIASGHFQVKSAQEAAKAKLERLELQGQSLSNPRFDKLKKTADSITKKGK